MDYTSQLNTIISKLNELIDLLTFTNNSQYILFGLLSLFIVLYVMKGD